MNTVAVPGVELRSETLWPDAPVKLIPLRVLVAPDKNRNFTSLVAAVKSPAVSSPALKITDGVASGSLPEAFVTIRLLNLPLEPDNVPLSVCGLEPANVTVPASCTNVPLFV